MLKYFYVLVEQVKVGKHVNERFKTDNDNDSMAPSLTCVNLFTSKKFVFFSTHRINVVCRVGYKERIIEISIKTKIKFT